MFIIRTSVHRKRTRDLLPKWNLPRPSQNHCRRERGRGRDRERCKEEVGVEVELRDERCS